MTELLDEALKAVSKAPAATQNDIASVILYLLNASEAAPVALSPEERSAIALSKAAAARGEFATDEQMQELWAKHGL
jgi:predicted solute-binding protein